MYDLFTTFLEGRKIANQKKMKPNTSWKKICLEDFLSIEGGQKNKHGSFSRNGKNKYVTCGQNSNKIIRHARNETSFLGSRNGMWLRCRSPQKLKQCHRKRNR